MLAAPFVSLLPRPGWASRNFDPSFGAAQGAVRALREGAISATELLDHVYERIGKHNSKVQAFITLNEEEARRKARLADEAWARRVSWGVLHGLPIVIKDTFETAGLRTTSGSKLLQQYIPTKDAVAVSRLSLPIQEWIMRI